MRTAAFLVILAVPAAADVLVLKDGNKVSGKIVEKAGHYEVTTDAGLRTFLKEEVDRVVTSPKELLGDSEKLFDEAKQEYQQALGLTDPAQQNAKLREAIAKLRKARETYAAARELFWEDKYADLDQKLVQVMQLMRLLRERVSSEVAGRPSAAPTPPPPPTPNPAPASAAPTLEEAFAIVFDPAKRADATRRASARDLLRAQKSGYAGGQDLASAAMTFLSRTDRDWKAEGASLAALQEYFSRPWLKEPRKLTPATHLEAAKYLADRIAALKKSDPSASGEALALFAAGHLGHATPGPETDGTAQALGLLVKEGVSGTAEGHAANDLNGWIATGDYDLAVLAYGKEFRAVSDTPLVRFLWSYSLLRQAQLKKRGFEKSVSALEGIGTPEAPFRDHAAALAKSIRNVAVCGLCGGEGKVRCTSCHGRKEVRTDCVRCKGVGATNVSGSPIPCAPCKGRGYDKLVRCDKCKDGFPECRRCDRKPRTPPEMDDICLVSACGSCEGRGLVFRKVLWPCRACMGLGQKLTPKADPTKILP